MEHSPTQTQSFFTAVSEVLNSPKLPPISVEWRTEIIGYYVVTIDRESSAWVWNLFGLFIDWRIQRCIEKLIRRNCRCKYMSVGASDA